ncbi:hypothetical protein ABTX60_09125 [Streptomyces sp. NPDC126510]|uniref:hypothetical protein n=1 Tax=Streptomyces sp. NPDC126510 TaxID=3155317 RepID=UPI00333426E3
MPIRHGLPALPTAGPRYGSRLRTEFEARTGGTWPLDIGQVYTRLGRLRRAQRRHVARALHDHVRRRAEALARAPEHPGEPARLLVLEQLVFQDEAEVRRLDHCEARLLRFAREEEALPREQPEA